MGVLEQVLESKKPGNLIINLIRHFSFMFCYSLFEIFNQFFLSSQIAFKRDAFVIDQIYEVKRQLDEHGRN